MAKNNLTEETYFSEENEWKYCGSSQFKAFMKCEAQEIAKLKGEWEEETSKALLVGSYVDNAVSGTLDSFKENHPELFKRDGELKSEYLQADYILERINRDEMFMKYVNGDHQTIMVGEIEDVPFKIKIDSYHKDKAIVDMKCIKDFQPVWNDELKVKQNFIDYWGYTLQGAIYQEVVRQNTGKKLPFFIAAVTKEQEPDLGLFAIPDDVLEEKLNEIKMYLPRLKDVKEGKIESQRCGKCNYCRYTKKLTRILDYREI